MKEMRNEAGQSLEEFLAAYDVSRYERPSLTADVAVFTLVERLEGPELAVLLVKRRNHPSIGMYALPGGFINMDEELHEAAARELMEETGVTGLPLRQFGSFGALDRDPRTRVVTTGFYGVAPMGSLKPRAGDDAAEASLFTVEVRRESASASAESYRMLLMGERLISAHARLCYDMLGASPAPAHPPQGKELASDHSHVLFAALYALSRQPRGRIARLLSLGGAPGLAGEARRALESALGDFDREYGA